jgi:hypothetical protein
MWDEALNDGEDEFWRQSRLRIVGRHLGGGVKSGEAEALKVGNFSKSRGREDRALEVKSTVFFHLSNPNLTTKRLNLPVNNHSRTHGLHLHGLLLQHYTFVAS